MYWVRNNTNLENIFVSWWDYGYWIQYIGERPSVTDGGHANGFWDHLIGRYVLTTPDPYSALSFMKAQNVSYLLIDPTDIGKYPAYSKIGSDETGEDRYSWIPTILSDSNQIQETRNGTIRIYQAGSMIDEDIYYNNMFFAKEKTALLGMFLETSSGDNGIEFKQPTEVLMDVNTKKQTEIPIRYIYYEGQIYDYGSGINATFYLIPMLYPSSSGLQIDSLGAGIYLSPRVMSSLVAKIYILNDPFDEFEGFNLAHSEPDSAIKFFESQGAELNEFIYYGGLRGPLKIWKIDYPSNVIERDEFLSQSGEYAEFDNLLFKK